MNGVKEYLGILIDEKRDSLIPEQGLALLLGDGFYKKEGETSPQQSFARAATCYSFGDYELAQRMYDYSSKGWFTNASPVLSTAQEVEWPTFSKEEFQEAGDWLEDNVSPEGLPISCFAAGTPILYDGGCKSIEDIVVGDRVLTHEGRFRGVVNTKVSKSSDLYRLKVEDHPQLIVTGNHLILTDIGWVRVDELVSDKHLVATSLSVYSAELKTGIGGFYSEYPYELVESPGQVQRLYEDITYVDKVVGAEETLVYDIEVEEDHSFSVGGVIAHNCFLSYIPDCKEGLVASREETAWLSMMGGGIGINPGMRSPDEKSTGVMAHLKGYDADALAYKQSKSRRGSIAAYLDINHPEIMSFIEMRDPVGGGVEAVKCFNLHNAVNLTDAFMEKVIRQEKYELIDPKHGPTGTFLEATEVWEKLMDMRHQTGEPYLHFIDTVNRARNSWITKPTYHVRQSNLCQEISLMTSEKRSAVCCLSSLNLAKYDEWKDTNIVEDLTRYLDNVLEYFIRLAPPVLKRAVHSASQERAIGIGALGWHSYLQQKSIPFESGGFNSAISLTHEIFSGIREKFIESSKILAKERGEPEDCTGSGMRNTHGMAIAPNASTSSLVNKSPGIEPWSKNAFLAQGRAGSFVVKNTELEKVLESLGHNTHEVWKSIMQNEGSVQHLDFLSDHNKLVYKTATEISPLWVVEQASARQEHICQGQSVNLFKDNTWSMEYMSDVHMAAWEKGLKGLYYMRGEEENKATLGDKPDLLGKSKLVYQVNDCLGCDG